VIAEATNFAGQLRYRLDAEATTRRRVELSTSRARENAYA
jgi:hypothetical protein